MISTIFQRFVISTFPIYTYFNVILTPGFTDGGILYMPRQINGFARATEFPISFMI